MSSQQPETEKDLLFLEDFGHRNFDVSGSSVNRSSFLSGIGSDFGGDDSNFLVRLDSVPTESGPGPSYDAVLRTTQEREDGKLPGQIPSAQKVGNNSDKVNGNERDSSENKENIFSSITGETCTTLSDLNIFIPPPLGQKKFIKPTLPSILELSYEEGIKAQSLAASRPSSASTISDYVNTADKHNLPKTRQAPEAHSESNAKPPKPLQADTRSKDPKTNFHDSGKYRENARVAPVSTDISKFGRFKEGQVKAKSDSWDAFDKVMEKSFVAEDFSRLEHEQSVTQLGLELDDAGFRSFTSLEAQELMDKDEAERLQLLTSANGTFSESFLNGNEGISFDKNISMGAYFGKRSSAPFKISDDSFSKNMSKISSKNDSLFLDNNGVDNNCTSPIANRVKNKNVSPSESFQSMFEDDECEPLKLPDTSLDTLGKFFMGPQSSYLSGNPQGMMDYIIDYCRQKAEKTLPLNHVMDVSISDPNPNEKSKFIANRSSGSSSGVSSSFESNKTLTPKSDDSKTPLNEDKCNKNYRKYQQESEHTDDQSVVIAGDALRPGFGISESILEMENTFENARYAQFEENLRKSIQDRPGHLDRLSERDTHLKYQIPLNSIEKRDSNNSIKSTNQMRLELLRKEPLSPPERLRTSIHDKMGSASSLGSNSGGAHSTPVQHLSLSATLAKQLGLGNMSSTYDSPPITSEPVEFNNGVSAKRPELKQYNLLNGDKIVNSNTVGKHPAYIENSSVTKSNNVNDAVSDKETGAFKRFNRFEERNVTEPNLNMEEEFYAPEFKNLTALEIMDRDQAERSKHEQQLNPYGVLTRESRTTSFPKTNPHINQVPTNAIVKKSTSTRSTDSGVQTSFIQPRSAVESAVTPIPIPSYNQGGNINQLVQSQNFGYPVIIQIHCACSGGVNVVSNQPSSSAFVQAAPVTHSHSSQKCIETPRQALQLNEPIPVPQVNIPQVPRPQPNLTNDKLVTKELIPTEKQKEEPPQAFIEVDKMSLIWGFVDFGQTVMNTVCLSNKQGVELRFKAMIVEKSYVKSFKFVLDPSDNRIKETERVGVLRPFASKQLKINFSPASEGHISGSIQLRFHSVPYTDLGFRGEIPLIVTEAFTGGQRKATKTNTSRAGDDIKILNTNVNFGRLVIGNTSRKVTTITNNGSSAAKFAVSPPKVSVIDGKMVEDNPFSSSVSEGTIAKGASREIIFTYRPGYYGKLCQNWTVDVTFVYSSIQMTKSTRITLEGECVKLE